MLTQKYNRSVKDEKDGCFAVGKSKQEVYNDLTEYCNNNPDKSIYYYELFRLNEENHCPEYILDIMILNKDQELSSSFFWKRVQ